MSGLKNILQHAADRTLKAGGTVSTGLIENLRGLRKRQWLAFLWIESVLVIGVAVCGYFASQHPHDSTQLKVIAGVFGIGAGGGVEAMRRLWKEWGQAELLLILIEGANESQIVAIITKLIKKL
jgi:hypothetical protein